MDLQLYWVQHIDQSCPVRLLDLFFSSWALAGRRSRGLGAALRCAVLRRGGNCRRTRPRHSSLHRTAQPLSINTSSSESFELLGWRIFIVARSVFLSIANPSANNEHLVMQHHELFISATLATNHNSRGQPRAISPLPNHGDPATPFRTKQQWLSKVWSEIFTSPTSPLAHGIAKYAS